MAIYLLPWLAPWESSKSCDYYPEVVTVARELGRRPVLLFCLAPHGVYPAPDITGRAVGSCPAFSPLPRFPKETRRYIFCDTFRRKELEFSAPPFSQGMLPYGVRTFLSRALARRKRPSATAEILPEA